ncbi:MAG: hypothetical protein JWR15_3572 [Prosthecobacter sp.]|nr:hypothetical protein [Prosthecobacter sp.]
MIALTSYFPSTINRVESSTCPAVNGAIHEEMVNRVARVLVGGPVAIEQRLQELDNEWDIERALETGAATMSLTTLALAATVDRRWACVTAAIGAFLLMHALQGWCPPVVIFRRLGVRTEHEIDVERLALRLLREDFRSGARTPHAALSIARAGYPTARDTSD